MNNNLFATVLTHPAPSANYRGEAEDNRQILQKITVEDRDYPIISSEAIRNALREILALSVPCNRRRLYHEEQLAVEYQEFPNPDKYVLYFSPFIRENVNRRIDLIVKQLIHITYCYGPYQSITHIDHRCIPNQPIPVG